jgi:gluconokinase
VQRLGDVLGHAVYPNDEPEASLRGAAIYALEKMGAHVRNAPLGKPVRPRRRWAHEHALARAKQLALEACISSAGL